MKGIVRYYSAIVGGTILYMAAHPNGMIHSRNDDSPDWRNCEDDWTAEELIDTEHWTRCKPQEACRHKGKWIKPKWD